MYATSTKLDSGDTVLLAVMERQQSQQLHSYDTDFNGISGVTRLAS